MHSANYEFEVPVVPTNLSIPYEVRYIFKQWPASAHHAYEKLNMGYMDYLAVSQLKYEIETALTAKGVRRTVNIHDTDILDSVHKKSVWVDRWMKAIDLVTWNPAHDYVKHAHSEFITDEMKTTLKAKTLLTKALQSEILGVQHDVEKQGTSIYNDTELLKTAMSTKFKYISSKHDTLEKNVDSLSTAISSIQETLSTLVAHLSIKSDVRKGEKVSEDKCKHDLILKLDDENKDGGSGAHNAVKGQGIHKAGESVQTQSQTLTATCNDQVQGMQQTLMYIS